MNEELFLKLVLKKLESSLSDEEDQRLAKELSAPERRILFERIQSFWEDAGKLKTQAPETSWNEVKEKIDLKQFRKPSQVQRSLSMDWYKWVAAAVLIIGAFALLKLLEVAPERIEHKTALEPQRIELPDGSMVWLNKNSSLEYYTDFNEKNRQVTLTGEGFFDVIHSNERPFTVLLNETNVRVLGTSFNIENYENTDKTKVSVVTGSVEFKNSKETGGLLLKPGYTGIWSGNSGQFAKSKSSELNLLAWRDQKLIFQSTALVEVIRDLEEYFGVEIEVQNENLLNCQFTMEFQAPSITEVLELLKITADISYQQKNQKYYLTGAGCH